jgi:hypothetical protein
MANVKQQLETPFVPSLGFPPEGYERRHFNENYGALNNFFLKLVFSLGSLFGPRGGKFLNNPYGAFHSSIDQVAASTTTAYPVFFGNTDFSNGVSVASDSRITVAVDGVWNLQFSLQIKNVSNDGQDFDIWIRKNGTNIADSNSRFHAPARKSSGDPSHLVAGLNFFVDMLANDYVEIVGCVTSTDLSLEAFAAGTSPTRPAIPSAIATMTFVSNLPTV